MYYVALVYCVILIHIHVHVHVHVTDVSNPVSVPPTLPHSEAGRSESDLVSSTEPASSAAGPSSDPPRASHISLSRKLLNKVTRHSQVLCVYMYTRHSEGQGNRTQPNTACCSREKWAALSGIWIHDTSCMYVGKALQGWVQITHTNQSQASVMNRWIFAYVHEAHLSCVCVCWRCILYMHMDICTCTCVYMVVYGCRVSFRGAFVPPWKAVAPLEVSSLLSMLLFHPHVFPCNNSLIKITVSEFVRWLYYSFISSLCWISAPSCKPSPSQERAQMWLKYFLLEYAPRCPETLVLHGSTILPYSPLVW